MEVERVNVSRYFDGASPSACAQRLGNALRRDGVVLICGHGMDDRLFEDAYSFASRFFSLPLQQKLDYYIGSSKNHRGYVPVSEQGHYEDEAGTRRYEAFDLGLELAPEDPHVFNGIPLMGPNNWPDVSGFQEAVYPCFISYLNCARRICACLEMYLETEPGSILRYMKKPITQMRLLHYLARTEDAITGASAMGAHTDYEFFTLIRTESAGLKIFSHRGEWISLNTAPGDLAMMCGDMLETLTNGLFRSVLHRVEDIPHERYSMPFFAGADFNSIIKPMTHGIRGARTQRYTPLHAGNYLLDRLQRDFPYLARAHRCETTDVVSTDSPFERRRFQDLECALNA